MKVKYFLIFQLLDYDASMCQVYICVQVCMHICEHICGSIELYGKYMYRCRGKRCRGRGGILSYLLHQLNSELEDRASFIFLALELHVSYYAHPTFLRVLDIQIPVLILAWLRI